MRISRGKNIYSGKIKLAAENLANSGEALILSLFSLYRTSALYSPSHPKFTETLAPVMEAFENVFQSHKKATFLIVEKEFIFDGEPLFRTLPRIKEFSEIFEKFHIERFTFSPGVTPEEVISLINLLASKPEEIKEKYKFDTIHTIFRLNHILLERLPKRSGDSDGISEFSGLSQKFDLLDIPLRKHYSDLFTNTNTIFKSLSKGEGGDLIILARQIDQTVDDLHENIEDFVDSFNKKKLIFGDYDHEINTCFLTMGFCKGIGLEREYTKILTLTALLHDLGKIFLPTYMRNKPEGLLTPKEVKSYRQHPLWGSEYLLNLQNVHPLTVIVCYEHHMGYDKSGFPPSPENHQPHFASLLVSIVEKYEQTVRYCSEHREVKDHIKEMKPLKGITFDPQIFDLFSSYMMG